MVRRQIDWVPEITISSVCHDKDIWMLCATTAAECERAYARARCAKRNRFGHINILPVADYATMCDMAIVFLLCTSRAHRVPPNTTQPFKCSFSASDATGQVRVFAATKLSFDFDRIRLSNVSTMSIQRQTARRCCALISRKIERLQKGRSGPNNARPNCAQTHAHLVGGGGTHAIAFQQTKFRWFDGILPISAFFRLSV